MVNYGMNGISKMVGKLTKKIKLFRILHDVNMVYVSTSGQLFLKRPENFTGKSFGWHSNGNKWYEWNFKNGKYHGKRLEWYDNGQLRFEGDFKNGKKITG